jgi:hypothetical protein
VSSEFPFPFNNTTSSVETGSYDSSFLDSSIAIEAEN